MMRPCSSKILAIVAVAGGLSGLVPCRSALAQGFGPSGSLGGYGQSPGLTSSAMNGGFIPYAGRFGGFMPYRSGGGDTLSFQTRSSPPMSSARSSFSLSGAGGMGQDFGTRNRLSNPMGSPGGMRLGGGMGGRSRGAGGMGVMPPRIGYPFREPPSLVPSAAAGLSM